MESGVLAVLSVGVYAFLHVPYALLLLTSLTFVYAQLVGTIDFRCVPVCVYGCVCVCACATILECTYGWVPYFCMFACTLQFACIRLTQSGHVLTANLNRLYSILQAVVGFAQHQVG